MGKKHKKEAKKRKHRSRSKSLEYEKDKEKRRHHKRHHKEKKREKSLKRDSSSDSDDDVVYVPPEKVAKVDLVPTPTKSSGSSAHRRSESPPPANSSSGDNALSIAETNALRAKLGLKPLSLPEDTTNGSAEKKLDFVHKPAENLTEKKMTEKIRSRLAERKAKRDIDKKLATVKPLGEEESDDESASAWVKKNKLIEEARKKAELKAKELDEMDQAFGIGDLVNEDIKREKTAAYSAANLKGLKVEHNIETFQEGRAVILTLKDKDVLAEEEDALINVNIVDDERYKQNLINKKQRPFGYHGADEMDIDEPRGVLTKYDEEIEGLKKADFVIGEEGLAEKRQKVKKQLQEKANMRIESLALPDLKIANEYYTREEMMKIKKPKKKKKIRKLTADDLMRESVPESHDDHGKRKVDKQEPEEDEEFVADERPSIKIERVDDEDPFLKRAKEKAMKLKTLPVEKLNTRLPKIEEVLDIKEEPFDAQSATIVLNSTAEFCRTLGDIPTYGMAGNREEEANILLDFEKEKEKVKKVQKTEVTEDNGGWNDVEMDEKVVEVKQIEAPILDAEPNLKAGVAGALTLALSKGYLEKETKNRPSASRISHLAAQNYSIDDKAHAAEDEKIGRRERYLGPTSDFKEKDGYKPNIKLEYIDDDGHLLSAKEAFRYLSHKFHGKGPGKNKVEKRMKKSEQEGLMKQMSSTDTPLGTLQMLQHKQKETHSAFVVLSGSKHQLNTPTAISKMTKTSKTKKRK